MKATSWFVRVVVLAALAIGIWALARYGEAVPQLRGPDAPATEFSGARAYATLGRILGPEKPHPASTAENAAVRARIIAEFARMGVSATTYTGMGCFAFKTSAAMGCGTVTDIIAPVLPGKGKAIVMMAHYDSVPAGPGAADDGSGVATVLETARALRARGGTSLHPVIALLTDGEEYGLMGASAFLENPRLKAMAGAAINVEARGNQGQSRLFQTSAGGGPLIDLYAEHGRDYATSSLYAEIYKYLPNDTDLTLFIKDGIPSVNFAFTGRVAHYHTPLDTRAHLSRTTLQEHGDNLLTMASVLKDTPYAQMTGGEDIYFDILGRWLPRLPMGWAIPGAIVVLLLVLGAVAVSHGRPVEPREGLGAAVMFPLALIGALLVGWLFAFVAQLVSGMPDPSFAHPLAMRVALSFGVAAVILAVARLAGVRAAAGAVWLWFAALGLVVAIALPGISPYFLLPAGFAAVLMVASARLGWREPPGQVALLLAAAIALVVWMQLVATGETLMGLKLHPLFTIPAAIGLVTLVPLLAADRVAKPVWGYSVAGCFAAGLVAAVVAGLQPAYSALMPQRLNLTYVADGASGRTLWTADATAPLPAGLRKAATFSAQPERPYRDAWQPAYVAPAPKAQMKMPGAAVLANTVRNGRRELTLRFRGAPGAAMMYAVLPGRVKLSRIVLGGKPFATPPAWADRQLVRIACMSSDCTDMTLTLDMADKGPVKLAIVERHNSLPAFGARLAAARPDTAVQSQFGDGTELVSQLAVPAAK